MSHLNYRTHLSLIEIHSNVQNSVSFLYHRAKGVTDDNTKAEFDIDATIIALRKGKDLTGTDGVLTPLIKQLTEPAIQAELNSHLTENSFTPNRKNGNTPKTIKSLARAFELQTPHDRVGTFEPQLVQEASAC